VDNFVDMAVQRGGLIGNAGLKWSCPEIEQILNSLKINHLRALSDL
jgi:hypothetical protein